MDKEDKAADIEMILINGKVTRIYHNSTYTNTHLRREVGVHGNQATRPGMLRVLRQHNGLCMSVIRAISRLLVGPLRTKFPMYSPCYPFLCCDADSKDIGLTGIIVWNTGY